MSEFSGRVRGVVNTPTVSAASGRWSVRAVSKFVAAGVWPSIPGPIAGDLVPLSVIRVPTGGVASISFDSIPQGHQHLYVRASASSTNTGTSGHYIKVNLNNDTANNYSNHSMRQYATTKSTYAITNDTSGAVQRMPRSIANTFGALHFHILDYTEGIYKTAGGFGGWTGNSADSHIDMYSFMWRSNSAVTSIRFTPEAALFAAGTVFALYGYDTVVVTP